MFRVLKSSDFSLNQSAVDIVVMDPTEFLEFEAEDEDIYDESDGALAEDGGEAKPEAVRLAQEKAVERRLQAARDEAEEIVRKAQQQAQVIVGTAMAQAQAAAEKIKDDSRVEGHNEGYNQGVAEASALKKKAEEVYDSTIAERDKIMNGIEGDALDLIVSILDKLMVDTAHVKPGIIVTLIRKALSEITVIGEAKLRVSGADYDMVVESQDDILEFVGSPVKLEIVKDAKLNRMDCVIETEFGLVDCSLSQQYEDLKASLYMICHSF